jgi:hypothetical protein
VRRYLWYLILSSIFIQPIYLNKGYDGGKRSASIIGRAALLFFLVLRFCLIPLYYSFNSNLLKVRCIFDSIFKNFLIFERR